MRILLVTGPSITLKEPFSSGIESFIVSLANQLSDAGHAVDVIAMDADPDRRFNLIQGTPDINDYDVVHYNLFIPEIYEAAAEYGRASVLTLHSPPDRQRALIYKRFARHCDVSFVAVSKRMKYLWDPALHTEMPVIHNGIDLDRWPLRRQGNSGYLMWSGRINPHKNVAAAVALARHTGQELKIAGRITDQTYFATEVKPYLDDRIRYVGHVTQHALSGLAAGALAFLATASWQEPFGLAVLEMLASGVPVIGFASAIPADLRYDPQMIVDSTDWHDLLEPLHRAGSVDPQACRDFAATMGARTMGQAYAELYRTIVERFEINSQERQSYTAFDSLGGAV